MIMTGAILHQVIQLLFKLSFIGSSDIKKQKMELLKPIDLLISTPGRLLTHRYFK